MARMMMAEKSMQEWKHVFPDFTTIEGSCLFIKKLIAVFTSSITFIRGIFPEKAYGNKDLGGLKLKILTENSGIKSVKKFIDYVRNCYDAVEKKYLQQMCIGVVPDPEKRDEIVELYNLVFCYKDDEYSVTCNGEQEISSQTTDPVKNATLLMLKNILTVSDMLGPLPKNAYLTIKLLYYDDVTPPDYEPTGFGPCEKEKFDFIGKTVKIQLGKIDTGAHSFNTFIKTSLGQEMSQFSRENSVLSSSQTKNIPSEEEPVVLKPSKLSLKTQSGKAKHSVETDYVLQCPCKCKTDDLSGTITCLSCGKKQHAVCYALLKSEEFPTLFYCVSCSLGNTTNDTSLDLVYSLSKREREDLCIMRRALMIISLCEDLTCTFLEKKLGSTKAMATKIVERLETEGFITKSGKYKYLVNEDCIRDYGFQKYFPDKDKENVDATALNQDYEESGFDDVVAGQNENEIEKMNSSNYDEDENFNEYNETDIVENSIRQVQAMNLGKETRRERTVRLSQGDINPSIRSNATTRSSGTTRSSHKRKLSNSDSLLHANNSDELFQSTSSRTKKPRNSMLKKK